MATCAQLTTWLAEAESALHNLSMGAQVVSIRGGDDQVTYSAGNLDKLQKYVAKLQQQVDACSGTRTFKRSVLGIIPVDSNN